MFALCPVRIPYLRADSSCIASVCQQFAFPAVDWDDRTPSSGPPLSGECVYEATLAPSGGDHGSRASTCGGAGDLINVVLRRYDRLRGLRRVRRHGVWRSDGSRTDPPPKQCAIYDTIGANRECTRAVL